MTTADGTWQTRGWHSKNATFSIRNYLNGALLYYHHLCQKGSDDVVEGGLYPGTFKSAEGYAANITFQRGKEEGMEVAVHWQDANSSSAKSVREVYPDAEIMICGGHAGRAHGKMFEKRQKDKHLTQAQIEKYKDTFPNVCNEEYQKCKCKKHSSGCGCLSDTFIAKAHTNFTSILIEAQSQKEYVKHKNSGGVLVLNQHTIHYDINIHEPLHTTTLDFRCFITQRCYRQKRCNDAYVRNGTNETLGVSDHSDHAIRAASGTASASGPRQGSWLGLQCSHGQRETAVPGAWIRGCSACTANFYLGVSVAIQQYHPFLLLLLAIFSNRQSVVSHLHPFTLWALPSAS